MINHSQKAMGLFKEGYNCSQSIFLAFSDIINLDEKTMLKISSSFGGGMGRLREVCGAVSGMFMVLGYLYGYSEPKAYQEKTEHYKLIQAFADKFKNENGSIICRELLGLEKGPDNPTPEKRTDAYYKNRPCGELIGYAAKILEEYIYSKEELK